MNKNFFEGVIMFVNAIIIAAVLVAIFSIIDGFNFGTAVYCGIGSCAVGTSIMITNRLFCKIFEKNQAKFVKKGYKAWFEIYTEAKCLENETEILLLELSKTSKKHLEILIGYEFSLCQEAYDRMFEDESLTEVRDEYMLKSTNAYIAARTLATKSVSNKRCEDTLYNHIKNGGQLDRGSECILIENEKLNYIFIEHVRHNYISNKAEIIWVQKAKNNKELKDALINYIEEKSRYYTKNICPAAECELINQGLVDVYEKYFNIVNNISNEAQICLTKKVVIENDENFQKFLEMIIHKLCNDAATILIDAALKNRKFVKLLEQYIGAKPLSEKDQMLLVDAYNRDNEVYFKSLEKHIKLYNLSEKARELFNLHQAYKKSAKTQIDMVPE